MAIALILLCIAVCAYVYSPVGLAWLICVLAPTLGKLLPQRHFSVVDPQTWFVSFHSWTWQGVGIFTLIILQVLNPARKKAELRYYTVLRKLEQQPRFRRFAQALRRTHPFPYHNRTDIGKLGFTNVDASIAAHLNTAHPRRDLSHLGTTASYMDRRREYSNSNGSQS